MDGVPSAAWTRTGGKAHLVYVNDTGEIVYSARCGTNVTVIGPLASYPLEAVRPGSRCARCVRDALVTWPAFNKEAEQRQRRLVVDLFSLAARA